jgi:trigger factor
MNSKLQKLENNVATLEISVSPEKLEEGLMKSYLKNAKKFNISGFRKGKAPRKIIERHYGEAVFYEDAINDICPDAYDEAVKEHNIDPVERPEIDIVEIESGKGIVFTATVTVKPEAELAEYKGIETDKKRCGIGQPVLCRI